MQSGWLLSIALCAGALVAAACEDKNSPQCRHDCTASGKCTLKNGQCIATDEGDCRRSMGCQQQGLCALEEQTCVANAAGCTASEECRTRGFCSPRGAACRALKNDDCRKTAACKEEGRCTASEGKCVPTAADCASTRGCQQFGKCSALDDHCVALTSADCEKSFLCKKQGYCTFHQGGCALLGDADCTKTDGCRKNKTCKYEKLERQNPGLPQEQCVR